MGRMLGSVAIIIAALVLFPFALIYVSRLRARLNFDYAMGLLARRAVLLARTEHGAALDYSPASIERVQGILGTIRESQLQKAMSDKELSIVSARWGAYIGEVMKRVRPAKWQRDSEKSGAGTEATPAPGLTRELWTARKATLISSFRRFRIHNCAVFSA
jgi:hypothetical protein